MRIYAEREVAQNLRSQTIAQANVLETDHPPLSDKISIRRPNRCPAVVLDTYGKPSPARIPVQNCAVFLQDYGNPAIAVCARASNPSHVSEGCHRFRSINGRLVAWHLAHAYRLPELLNVLCDRIGLAGRGQPRTVRFARCKTTWFASGPQPVPEMATAETVSEAEEAFRG